MRRAASTSAWISHTQPLKQMRVRLGFEPHWQCASQIKEANFLCTLKPLTPRADFGRSPHPSQSGGRTMWGLLSAVCQFLNFSNRTIIKGDILKIVKQSQKNDFLQNRPLKSATKKL